MKFLLIYHGGNVPEDETQKNIDELWRWLATLNARGGQAMSFVANGGRTRSQDSVDGYLGKVFGISIIEAESIDAAVERTRDWPELRYGGKIDILAELAVNRNTRDTKTSRLRTHR